MRQDHADAKSKLNLLQEEEEKEVDPHLPLQNGQEEQTRTTTLRPVSLVKVAGIGDAGGQRGRLVPARLNLPIFHSTDVNADVTYDIWCFDVQGWLD